MHMHIEAKPERLERAVRHHGRGRDRHRRQSRLRNGDAKSGRQASEFERFKGLTDSRFPGRFVHYMILDYDGWAAPDLSESARRGRSRTDIGSAPRD